MKFWLAFIASLSLSANAFGFYTFQDTGDLLEPGRYAVGTEVQFVTSGDSGANILGKFDGGLTDSLNYRAIVGFGNTDVQLSGLVKWVPIPDYEKQPAVGLTAGVLYARYRLEGAPTTENELSLRFSPFASKKFEVEFGTLTPYVAVPFAIRTYDDETDVPVHFVLGSKYTHPDVVGTEFTAEIGFDMDDAFNYISFGAIFPLDENMRFQFLD